jgi:glycosyltransferase involved in cell wall biosynthesis
MDSPACSKLFQGNTGKASTSPRRVLVLSGFRVFPATNGAQVRTSGIARALARMGYDVLLYSLAGRREDYRSRPASGFKREVIEDRLVEETNLGWGFGVTQAVMRRIEVHRSWQVPLLRAGILPPRLAAAIADADAVVSDMIYCPPPRRLRHGKPWFMISHQLEHLLLRQGPIGQRSVAGYIERLERNVGRLFDGVLAVSEDDERYFMGHDDTRRLMAPIVRCGVDAMAYVRSAADRSGKRAELGVADDEWLLAFSGSAYRPNVEACARLEAFGVANGDWLAQRRVRLLLLGSMVERPYRAGAVIATGRVPEVLPYFSAADAGFNPITSGAGANVKLFEYMAARLPVISTAFGVRGTEFKAGIDYVPIIADDFAAAISALLAGGSREDWRVFAEAAWQRHESACDIGIMVRDAVRSMPAFPPP